MGLAFRYIWDFTVGVCLRDVNIYFKEKLRTASAVDNYIELNRRSEQTKTG